MPSHGLLLLLLLSGGSPSNWVETQVGGDQPPLLLGSTFLSNEVGIAVGGTTERGPAAIYRTEDGGQSWSVARLESGSGRLYGVHAVSKSTAYAVGYGVIVVTRDAGKTWRAQSLPADRWLAGVSFANDVHGFAVGGHGSKAVFWETLDGKSWRDAADRLPAEAPALRDITFLDAKTGFVVGDDGFIARTNDGGETWQRVTTDVTCWLRSIRFSGDTGWIAAKGALLRSDDRGRTWQSLPGWERHKLDDVNFVDRKRGWIASFDGTLYETSDGGTSWTVAFRQTGHLCGIDLSAKNSVIVVGGDGRIHRRAK